MSQAPYSSGVRVEFPARQSPGVVLQGELLDGGGPPCVLSHPHPLGGGDMEHPVVASLWRAAAAAGLKALRYNFRGVQGSTGRLEGDSPLPLGDLGGAIDFLGGGPVLAIGYSYGARVTLHALGAGGAIGRAALVALPTRLPANRAAMSKLLLGRPIETEQYVHSPDLDRVAAAPRPVRIFAGELDPLVVSDRWRERGVEPTILPGVNHFFSRWLGNQPPDKSDLELLAESVLGFLLSE